MRKVCCIAIISTIIAMSGCAVDPVEDQEGESSVETLESEVVNTVQLVILSFDGVWWQWQIRNYSGAPAYRRVVYANGEVNGCRGIGANSSTLPDWTLVQPIGLTYC